MMTQMKDADAIERESYTNGPKYTYKFIEKIKTFSYNKKDLAWGIESNAICTEAIRLLLTLLLG